MELSRDQEIRVLEEIARSETKLTDDDYTFYLKKDEWTEMGAIWLFDPDLEQVIRWYGLIESSRNAGKLEPSRYKRRPYPSKENIYYYDPFVIISWAIDKKIPLPDKLIQWHDQQLKLKQIAATKLEPEQTNQPGTDAPTQSKEGIAGGLEAETLEDAGADNPALEPREGGYWERDKFAIELVNERQELLKMRRGGIKAELQKASDLFKDGRFTDWWITQKIFPKGKGGRTKGSRNRNKNG